MWAYRTTPKRSTGETLFSLTYGVEAVIPTEVSLCSARVAGFDPIQNADLMMERLDWLEECREATTIRLAEYQQRLAQRYNRNVKGVGIQCRGTSAKKGRGKHARHNCRKACSDLGGTIQSYSHRGCRGLLLGRPRREATSPAVERQQLKEILCMIIRVSQNLYFAKIKIMMNLFLYAVFGSVTAHQETWK